MQDAINEGSSGYPTRQERVFFLTIDSYLVARNMSPVVATRCDLTDRQIKWSPDSAHFVIDLEHAAETALGNDAGLMRTFLLVLRQRAAEKGFCDQHPQHISPELLDTVIRRVVRIIDRRELLPTKYFRKTHLKRRAA